MTYEALLPIAHSRHGLVTRSEARAAGIPESVFQRAAQRWPRLLPGVYWTTPTVECLRFLADRGSSRSREWYVCGLVPWKVRVAAALARWPEARLGGLSAAHEQGWAAEPSGLSLLVPQKAVLSPPPGIRIRRESPGERLPSLPGTVRMTRVDDTVLDVVQGVGDDQLFTWLCRAVGSRRTTPVRLLERLGERGRLKGRAVIVAALRDAAHGTASELERRYVKEVHRPHGLPRMAQQLPRPVRSADGGVGTGRVDVAYEAQRVVVELDGRLGHVGEGAFRDRRRDNVNQLDGWATLRFGWHDVVSDPCAVARDVALMLRHAGWLSGATACPRCRGTGAGVETGPGEW